jgi:uncharacterized protein DUF3300
VDIDLGNAFLAQQSDVMDAVQRIRKKAQGKGTLKTSEQQKVEVKVVEQKSVIVIEQANPQVVYVPSYNPVVVYGPAYYPYPPIYYPPCATTPRAWRYPSGRRGDGCFLGRPSNHPARDGSRGGSGNNKWSHNPQNRGGTPYRDRATANRFGGSARRDSLAQRQQTRGIRKYCFHISAPAFVSTG